MCYVFYSKLSDSTAVTVNSGGDKPRPYKKLARRKVGAGFIPARKQHIIDCGGCVQELLNSDDLMSCILILGALPECGGAFSTSSNQWPILCALPVRTIRFEKIRFDGGEMKKIRHFFIHDNRQKGSPFLQAS